jgi:hypothetical protein
VTREEEIAARQATCDCGPNFHVCTAIAETERLEEFDARRAKEIEEGRLETLRQTTLHQAIMLRDMGNPGIKNFADSVIELLKDKE